MVFAPVDCTARFAALVPTPRVHLTRNHVVFTPPSRWRSRITPAGRGSGAKPADTLTPAERGTGSFAEPTKLRRTQGP